MNFVDHLFERSEGGGGEWVLHLARWACQKAEVVTFPLWNVSGQLVGYQQYNWKGEKKVANNKEGKYWTYTPKGKTAVWGLEFVDLASTEDLYLTEGVWDALSVTLTGRRCLAVLSNNPQHLKSWLRTLPCKVVAVCEGDKAGRMLAKVADEAVYLPEGEDANSMNLKELDEVLNAKN